MSDEKPPIKRFTITVQFDAHSTADAYEILQRIAINDTHAMDVQLREGRCGTKSVSGDRMFAWTQNDGYTPQGEYDAALTEWFNATRPVRS